MDGAASGWTVADLELRAEASAGHFAIEKAPANDDRVVDGRLWTERVRTGLALAGADIAVGGALRLAETSGPMLALYLNVADQRCLGTARSADVIAPKGSLAVIRTIDDSPVRETLRAGQRITSAGVIVTDALIETLEPEDADQLRTLLAPPDRDGDAAFMPASAQLHALGHQLLARRDHGVLQGLHREALALSFLVEAARLIDGRSCPTAALLDARIAARLDEVAASLDAPSHAQPDFASLARIAGMSPISLRRHFKARFGETIVTYARRRRLERSRALLEEKRLSIAEIAWHCGYADAANFTNAFRRHFGCTPGCIARG